MAVDTSQTVVDIQGGVGRILLNRPERRNALSLAMLEELSRRLTELGEDPAVRVVTIAGTGQAFSAGHDLSEMIDREQEFYDALFATCTQVMLGIHACPRPVIAQVHGMATAAGCQLVAACDLAVASEDARFATPGVKIGLFCSTPMVPITRAIGRKRAMHMLLTGSPIDATTALGWGLVNEVVPRNDLEETVAGLAAQIMRYSREVIELGKAGFYAQLDAAESAAYRVVEPIMSHNARLEAAQEGMSAFLEKRQPIWPG